MEKEFVQYFSLNKLEDIAEENFGSNKNVGGPKSIEFYGLAAVTC